MGKHWDKGVPDAEMWAQVFRVLKPGAHLLSFFGTRTYHRGAVAIEDAGFEIRDQIGWLYGSGFPKSLDVSKAIDKAAGAEREVVGARVYGDGHVQRSSESIGYRGSDPNADTRLQTAPATEAAQQWDGWGTALKPAHETMVHAVKPLTVPWLCEKVALTICRSPSLASAAKAASTSSPSVAKPPGFALWCAVRFTSTQDDLCAQTGMSPSELARISSWSTAYSWLNTLAEAWRLGSTSTIATEIGLITDLQTLSCLVSENTLDAITKGATRTGGDASSALAADAIFKSVSAKCEAIPAIFADAPAIVKDADNGLRRETIVVARKPLSGTVANNVLTHGVGGLSIDACRVGIDEHERGTIDRRSGAGFGTIQCAHAGRDEGERFQSHSAGRWPANVIHDGSDEVLAEFAKYGETSKTGSRTARSRAAAVKGTDWFYDNHESVEYQDTGTAARFFYTAKASKDDRNDGLHDYGHTDAAEMTDRKPDSAGLSSPRAGAGRTSGAKNHHPTVKPTSLMRYLVRLVTPKGGLVLDPFAGSGTTLIAAYREDCRAIGIELDPDYYRMASHRIDNATAQMRLAL
jgi:hypothetical protein